MAERCRETVWDRSRGHAPCSRAGSLPWVTPDGVVKWYCKQHHPDTVAARREASAAEDVLKLKADRDRRVRNGLREATDEELAAEVARRAEVPRG